MSKRFLKLNLDNDEADFLAANHPNAFILLYFIARRARRISGNPDGLEIGECHLGDWESMGLSRQNYRTALKVLSAKKLIQIIETNRNRKNSTIGLTTKGTKVKLLNSVIWDINLKDPNHSPNHCLTTAQPRTRRNKIEKEDHPLTPSSLMTDDFSLNPKIEIVKGIFLSQKDLDACIQIKGSIEGVRQSIAFIQESKRRKKEILDWPNALANWKIENTAKVRVEDNLELAKNLSSQYPEFINGKGFRFRLYYDNKKDQKGLLIEPESAYKEAFFVSFVDGEFKSKISNFMKTNGIGKK